MINKVDPEGKDSTFTKAYMSIIVFLYFTGALIGTVLVLVAAIIDIKHGTPLDTSMFIAYAAYLGGPTATAIGFYAWKKIGRASCRERV